MRSGWTPFGAEKVERPPEGGRNDVYETYFTTPQFSISDPRWGFSEPPTRRGAGATPGALGREPIDNKPEVPDPPNGGLVASESDGYRFVCFDLHPQEAALQLTTAGNGFTPWAAARKSVRCLLQVDVELISERSKPCENVAELMDLLFSGSFTGCPRQFADLFG